MRPVELLVFPQNLNKYDSSKKKTKKSESIEASPTLIRNGSHIINSNRTYGTDRFAVNMNFIGNNARYIRRSCKPNCCVVEVNIPLNHNLYFEQLFVGNYLRFGIFATADALNPGKEVTIPWDLENIMDKIKTKRITEPLLCGCAGNRGTMSPTCPM